MEVLKTNCKTTKELEMLKEELFDYHVELVRLKREKDILIKQMADIQLEEIRCKCEIEKLELELEKFDDMLFRSVKGWN